MNCANILNLFVVLCVLVAPSFTAPANENGSSPPAVANENKDVSQNELDSNLSSNPKKDVEPIQPVGNQGAAQASPVAPETPQFVGGSSGTIVKIGIDGPCMY